jgi:hypothetical protein
MLRDVSRTSLTTTSLKEEARAHTCTLSASICPRTRQSPSTSSTYGRSLAVDTPHERRISRTFSVYLHLSLAPEDLITKFVECLVRLSNLKTLEILGAGPRAPISKALKRKYATFPSIRELRITPACHHFIKNCPNLENLTFTRSLDTHAPATILSHGERLRRITGVPVQRWRGMHGKLLDVSFNLSDYLEGACYSGWVGLPEPSGNRYHRQHPGEYFTWVWMRVLIPLSQSYRRYLETLKQLKHLTVVDADLDQGNEPHDSEWEEARTGWRRDLISLLKDSPSTDRKVLRWKVVQRRLLAHGAGNTYDVVENEEIEVSEKTPL